MKEMDIPVQIESIGDTIIKAKSPIGNGKLCTERGYNQASNAYMGAENPFP
jgi:hypothetical protein